MSLLEMHAKQRQEISRRADAWRLLERPEQGLHLRRPATLFHAEVVVLRIGSRLAGLQVRFVEILHRQGGVCPAILPGGWGLRIGGFDDQDRALGLLLAGELCARPFDLGSFLALPSPLGAAQDLRLLCRVGMMVPEMVRAGGVPLMSPLGVEDTRRRHQEDDEEQDAHERSDRLHKCSPGFTGSYVGIVQVSTDVSNRTRRMNETWGESGQPSNSTEGPTRQ